MDSATERPPAPDWWISCFRRVDSTTELPAGAGLVDFLLRAHEFLPASSGLVDFPLRARGIDH
jgi:hypothetical protein